MLKRLNNRKQKGFTIIELVIVIAVIAVLAAVLIPTFINLTAKANKAADESLVTNLNKALAIEEVDHEINTMHDAIESLDREGYNADVLVTKSNQKLLYSLDENRFLLEEDKNEGRYQGTPDYKFWTIQDSYDSTKQQYSIYATDNFSTATIAGLKVGFDAGDCNSITNIAYVGVSETQNVVIRTNSYSAVLTIDAEHDTVTHYGKANKVDITAVDNNNCYNEHGDIAGNINLEKGKVVVHNDCSAGAVVIDMTAVELATVTTLSADNSANKEVPIILNTSEVLWSANPNNGLINPTTNNIIYSSTGGTLPEDFNTMTNEEKEAAIASASDDLVQGVAAIKNTGYPTLQAAIDAAQNGDVVVLLDNVSLSSGQCLTVNKTITLNMNGKEITGNRDAFIIVGATEASYNSSSKTYTGTFTHEGNLTIRGNGTITNSNYCTLIAFDDAILNIYDGNYSSYSTTISAYDALVNIYGGTFTSTGTGSGVLIQLNRNSSGNFYSGVFTTSNNNGNYGIYLSNASEVNLGKTGEAGPTMSTWRPCIATNGSLSKACTINIYSGTYKANRNNTTIDDQTVIQIANASNEVQALNIYGGYFEQTSHLENSCIFTLKYSGKINMNISGGTFNTGNSKYFCGYGTNGSGYPSASNIIVKVENDVIPNNVTVEVYGSGVVRIPERDFVVNQ